MSSKCAVTAEGERYVRVSLSLKPGKTDPAGKEHWVKTFRLDPDPEALSAGAAVCSMLSKDPVRGDPTLIPLFRNPATGEEITYAESREELSCALRRCGFPALAGQLHSLRIGGATATSNDPLGGDFVTGCMGLWRGESRLRYMHALRERLEAASYSIGRASGGTLAARPGPLSLCRS